MHVYFVATDRTSVEDEVISNIKPERLLCSYFYFRAKGFKKYIEKLGYRPKIILDSGAYSAWTSGKNISIVDYMKFINENEQYIENYIALDVFSDSDLTYDYYKIMRKKGFKPIPVFAYGASDEYLQKYVNDGNVYIALGATVPITDKKQVAKWVNQLSLQYPDINFHLLGSSSLEITCNTDLYSCDSSTWIMQAINGEPRHILGKGRDKKVLRAMYNMRWIMNQSKLRQLKIV